MGIDMTKSRVPTPLVWGVTVANALALFGVCVSRYLGKKTLHGGIAMVILSFIEGAIILGCIGLDSQAGYYVMAVVCLLGLQIPGHNLRQNVKWEPWREPLVAGQSEIEQ